MGSLPAEVKKPWIQTPCIPSAPLSKAAGCNIFLKLENLQPSGSFKSRGVGNLVFRTASSSPRADVHFYCSSGGNAGLACATAAAAIGRRSTIVVPMSTSPMMVAKLKVLGANIHQVGANFGEADRHLREELVNHDPDGVYVPPFDHPYIWDGAATMVDELHSQMAADQDIDGIVCSVGGGGLLNGIMQGIQLNRWPAGKKPRVMAVETKGAESLHASLRAGELITLPKITSIATSLGAPRVSEKTWEWAQDREALTSVVVSDAEAATSCVRFADDARFLVEAACGATLAVAYNGDLRKHFGAGLSDTEWQKKNIVLIVCGGSNITFDMLNGYREKYGV